MNRHLAPLGFLLLPASSWACQPFGGAFSGAMGEPLEYQFLRLLVAGILVPVGYFLFLRGFQLVLNRLC